MIRTFRWKLFLILFVFALALSLAITVVDFLKMRDHIIEDDASQVAHAERSAISSLTTMDKALHILDQEITEKMGDTSSSLQEKYNDNDQLDTWDFDALAESYDMDIYMIDEESTVAYSNDQDEIGLNFSKCCGTLNKQLEKRRETGELYTDVIDIEQKTGDIKKFSYMATADHKYLIELAYDLQNEEVFNAFNFIIKMEEIVDEFEPIMEMNVYGFSGLPYESLSDTTDITERKQAVRNARDTGEIVEVDGDFKGHRVTYRYIPYIPEYQSEEQPQVIEMIYNNSEVINILTEQKRTFIYQLIAMAVLTILVAFIISKWFSKPVQMAFTDSLTGLRNRAAFDNDMDKIMHPSSEDAILMLMDLDNFKFVNDLYGHNKGDELLHKTAQILLQVSKAEQFHVYRFGGDEFIIIIRGRSKAEVAMISAQLLHEIQQMIGVQEITKASVSMSIGIAPAKGITSKKQLFNCADRALYYAKSKGKNNYQFYEEKMDRKKSV